MRKSTYSAFAVVASVALLSVGAPTVAQANTMKELNVNWVNNANGTTDLEFVGDGPSFKTASLDTGDSVAWDVNPGQYKVTVEDVSEFLHNVVDECHAYGDPGSGHFKDLDGDGVAETNNANNDNEWLNQPAGTVKIMRMGDTYKAWPIGALLNGEITTNIKKDRRTSILVEFHCDTEIGIGL